MKVTFAAIFALCALASAELRKVPRQAPTQPDASVPAMTDKDGNIINFDSTKVYKAASNAGL